MKEHLLTVSLNRWGKIPEWIRLVPLEKTELRDNRELFETTVADLEAMLAAFQEDGLRLVIDYEHQTLSGGKAPAAGWITDLEVRPDGLYARVDWTEEARTNVLSAYGRWKMFWPPWDYNCRCGAHTLSAGETAALGLEVKAEMPPISPQNDFHSPSRGGAWTFILEPPESEEL